MCCATTSAYVSMSCFVFVLLCFSVFFLYLIVFNFFERTSSKGIETGYWSHARFSCTTSWHLHNFVNELQRETLKAEAGALQLQTARPNASFFRLFSFHFICLYVSGCLTNPLFRGICYDPTLPVLHPTSLHPTSSFLCPKSTSTVPEKLIQMQVECIYCKCCDTLVLVSQGDIVKALWLLPCRPC